MIRDRRLPMLLPWSVICVLYSSPCGTAMHVSRRERWARILKAMLEAEAVSAIAAVRSKEDEAQGYQSVRTWENENREERGREDCFLGEGCRAPSINAIDPRAIDSCN